MDELTNQVAQRTGLGQEDAQKAVQVVIDSLKSRLPAPIAAELDNILSSGLSGGVDALENEAGSFVKGEIGNFLGKL